jgi:hypothetical protein
MSDIERSGNSPDPIQEVDDSIKLWADKYLTGEILAESLTDIEIDIVLDVLGIVPIKAPPELKDRVMQAIQDETPKTS